ncbi:MULTISPECIES: RBBP9/YdeN family alpha/beta hydrolase [unclassified Sphingomonas]|uniref:RBBP9/YdeN family alpha/beta hydrolase n=1 Tax=unclassified Sphingomonas TaxID=196159 RepID=UPI001D11C8F4|nr:MULTISPECIES: alpha/beta hydrolase [unclassified Sphingomonas]MCC2981258.1 alpha/beta hydrolase [Sphingomonas sp. IC4-52]MCD2316969.1 alpha/beta hydrolase [Sphingomonas sp. IC-11]
MGHYSSSLGLNPSVLTVPGLGNSGPTHWQTLWEQSRLDTRRVELGMWDTPHRNAWVTKLDQAIAQAKAPVILVGHSLGCQAIAWWASLSPQPYGWPVAGALLVAPADVDRAGIPPELSTFAPAPRTPLPFPSILVASTDDPWIEIDRAHSLAADWGSHFVDAGAQGHLNAASGLGWWPDGQELLERVIAASGGPHGEVRAPGDARAILAQASAGSPSGIHA